MTLWSLIDRSREDCVYLVLIALLVGVWVAGDSGDGCHVRAGCGEVSIQRNDGGAQ